MEKVNAVSPLQEMEAFKFTPKFTSRPRKSRCPVLPTARPKKVPWPNSGSAAKAFWSQASSALRAWARRASSRCESISERAPIAMNGTHSGGVWTSAPDVCAQAMNSVSRRAAHATHACAHCSGVAVDSSEVPKRAPAGGLNALECVFDMDGAESKKGMQKITIWHHFSAFWGHPHARSRPIGQKTECAFTKPRRAWTRLWTGQFCGKINGSVF